MPLERAGPEAPRLGAGRIVHAEHVLPPLEQLVHEEHLIEGESLLLARTQRVQQLVLPFIG